MKKTLIALLAMAGVASAATVAEINTTDTGLITYLDFTPDANGVFASTYGEITFANDPTLKDGYGIISSGATMYTTKASGAKTNAFTFSFDVRSFGKGDLLSIANSTNEWNKITLNSGDDGNLNLLFRPTNATVDTTLDSGSSNDWTTITLVGTTVTKNNTTSTVVELYVDGTYINALNMTAQGATDWCVGSVNGFQFGNDYGREGNTYEIIGTAEIDNVLLYNRALTASEVKALTVPEPTTAALSLLALAGLAARRRRK